MLTNEFGVNTECVYQSSLETTKQSPHKKQIVPRILNMKKPKAHEQQINSKIKDAFKELECNAKEASIKGKDLIEPELCDP